MVDGILETKNDLADALEKYLQGIEIYEQVIELRVTQNVQRNLEIAYKKAADILRVANVSKALELYQKRVAIVESLFRD